MEPKDTLFDWADGIARFRGLPVQWLTLTIAGRTFRIAGLADAADLLDFPDFAKSFVEEDLAPYGTELWAVAPMLAAYILEGEDGAGRRAIEIGCGLGLVAAAASLKGWRTLATDHDPTSLRFARYNAALNNVDIAAFALLDWHAPPAGTRFERVFGADILYEPVDHEPILRCIDSMLTLGGVALLADPNRGVADRFETLAERHGFDVQRIPTSGKGMAGRDVNGRIFLLRRAAA